MPRSFDMAAEYGGTVEQVHRAFRDEEYWLVRLQDSGADYATLDDMTIDADGGIRVRTTQTLRAGRLPGVVTQFHRGDLSFVREELWSPIREGRASATVTGAIPGAPAGLTGTAVLGPAQPGSRMALTATVEVRVPLVGGKIENFIGSQLVDLLIAEQRFTTVWITENS
ncbi:DUF2505 domain-containing protein [Mycolicibacterium psychrotolerans]|uniref:DUF2505 domain-containing protein n=1 Tax=Mycolicibacterium psychrotolerans TaxID=216929 RepID=A0A7I7M5Z0_9MYCO|nr:DUF2505 domain-containing protein [Mycolicibacterium psychrotolerans]BBX66799.1 hypothetical protein MPSYJ_02600 [Mycolicibacterium psychrotolerans]